MGTTEWWSVPGEPRKRLRVATAGHTVSRWFERFVLGGSRVGRPDGASPDLEQERTMARRGVKQRLIRAAMALVVGGSVFQLGSCDPAVRATLLTGLEQTTGTLLNTVNSAFFISLQDDEDTGGDTGALTTT